MGVSEPSGRLLELLAASRDLKVTDEELREQRISFAFGNSLNSDRITKDSVRQASQSIRLLASVK
jgi:hypothetical protein